MNTKRVVFRRPKNGWQSPGRVVLNWSGDPIADQERVAEHYRSVAHDRVAALRESPGHLRGGGEFGAYPIVFLYRQAFELSLKSIVIAGSTLLRDAGVDPLPTRELTKHHLVPLYQEFSRIWTLVADGEKSYWDFGVPELRSEDDLRSVVKEFDAFDSGSYAFRYTVGRDAATPNLPVHFEFDLFAFSTVMDRILTALENVPQWIRDLMQARWEAAYEAQREVLANMGLGLADSKYFWDEPE